MGMFRDVIEAYVMIAEKRKKQKDFERLKATPLNYMIIKDLINSAAYGILIDLTLADGTKLSIKREDNFDKAQQARSEYF